MSDATNQPPAGIDPAEWDRFQAWKAQQTPEGVDPVQWREYKQQQAQEAAAAAAKARIPADEMLVAHLKTLRASDPNALQGGMGLGRRPTQPVN